MSKNELNEPEKNKLLEDEAILLEKEHWETEGEKFIRSKRYLDTLPIKNKET